MSLPTLASATADTTTVTADSGRVTMDRVGQSTTRPGWPCALLGSAPPSVADRQSDPTADDVLPAILALAPRGPAWGTDEAGGGRGASPIMRRVWRALAAWVADLNRRDFEVATQAFPSAVTIALDGWEAELALPDACLGSQSSIEARLAAIRTRFGALGGSSRDYMICLAAALGYAITIEEPTQFLVDDSEVTDGAVEEGYFTCDDGMCDAPIETYALTSRPGIYGDQVAGGIVEDGFACDDGELDADELETFEPDPDGDVWQFWIVRVRSVAESWFTTAGGDIAESSFAVDEGELDADPLEVFRLPVSDPADLAEGGECDGDPIEGFAAAEDLECVLRRACPPHTRVVFAYELAA